MEGGPCPLFVSASASGSAARSSSPKRFPPPCLRNRPQGSVLQRLRVGVLAGLHKVVQVEVARDERGGLAVRLVQGQRLIPLQVACSKRGRWLNPNLPKVFI